MKKPNKIFRSEYFSCRKAIPVMLVFRLALLKYLFQKVKYPLFILSRHRGGILSTYRMQKKLKMNKFVRFNRHYYFSLTVPHWPSKAFDNMVAGGGLNITAAGTPAKKQIDTVILGFSRKCSYKCGHCYEHFNLGETEIIPVSVWRKVISQLQDSGVSITVLSGGEPMMRYDDLIEILMSADHSRSDFHIHTSGYGVTGEKARALKMAGLHAAGIGLDDCDPERNDTLRGFQGAYKQAVDALGCFREAGVFTYVNMCPTKEFINSGRLIQYMELLRKLNVGMVRWLEPRPCGGFSGKDSEVIPDEREKSFLRESYLRFNSSAQYADYPSVSYEAFYEDPENIGCMMAGNSQLYIDSLGNVQPCVFLPVSFGNILTGNFADIYAKMKLAVPRPLKDICPAIMLDPAIKRRRDISDDITISFEEISEEFEVMYRKQPATH